MHKGCVRDKMLEENDGKMHSSHKWWVKWCHWKVYIYSRIEQ